MKVAPTKTTKFVLHRLVKMLFWICTHLKQFSINFTLKIGGQSYIVCKVNAPQKQQCIDKHPPLQSLFPSAINLTSKTSFSD